MPSLNTANRSTSILCKLCSALKEDYLAPGKMLHPDTPPLPLLDMGFRHHESLRDMRAMAGDGCELCTFLFRSLVDSCYTTRTSMLPHPTETLSSLLNDPSSGTENASEHGVVFLQLSTLNCAESISKRKSAYFGLDMIVSAGYNGDSMIRGFELGPVSIHLEIPSDCMDSFQGYVIGRAVEEAPNFKLAMEWIHDCTTNHQDCASSSSSGLPSRLLDLSSDGSSVDIRLIENDGQFLRYTALSHCWGFVKPLVTNKSNYSDHLKAIPSHKLPRTFQDAVTTTRRLGIRYLWIDSLCIIQDEIQDWEAECPKMGAIYGNSVLTIGAADAVDSDAGFLHNRGFDIPSFTRPYVLQYTTSSDSPLTTLTLRHRPDRTLESRSKPALSTRGWAVQERLFSRRILYFGKDQLYWECNSCSHFEKSHVPLPYTTFRGDIAPKYSLSNNLPIDLCHSWWRRIVTTYSACELTYISDRLPAISGIASIIAQITGDKYIAGLWEADLPRSLLWAVGFQGSSSTNLLRDRDTEYLAPSWSWASKKEIHYPYFHTGVHETDSTSIKILHANMQHAGSDPYGHLRTAVIKVQGKVKIGFFRRFNFGRITSVHLTSPPYEDTNLVGEFHVDDDKFEEQADQAGGWSGDWHHCLFVGKYFEDISQYVPETRLSTYQYALVLEPLSTDGYQYRRIGLVKSHFTDSKEFYKEKDPSCRLHELQDWFDNCEERIIEIV